MGEARKNPDVIALIVIVIALVAGCWNPPPSEALPMSFQPLVLFSGWDAPAFTFDLDLPLR